MSDLILHATNSWKTFKIKEFVDACELLEDKQQTEACAVESFHKEDVSKLQQGNSVICIFVHNNDFGMLATI